MRSIPAPEGYEGSVFYDDGIRCYRTAFRRIGDTFWTHAWSGSIPVHLPIEEVDARASASIVSHINVLRLARQGGV